MISQRALLALAALGLASCQPGPERANQANKVAAGNVAKPPAVLPLPPPPLDRRAILIGAFEAASAVAAGTDDRETQKELDGARFELPIRFACGAPLERLPPRANGWSHDEKENTFRVRFFPDLSLADPLVKAVAGDAFEAAEGVWLSRPWVLQPACGPGEPRTEPGPDEGDAAETKPARVYWRVGIAQFFSASDSRTRRRFDRPYEAVEKLEKDEALPTEGFDLVLAGRLRALADGRVLHCHAGEGAGPPDCLISVVLDSVEIRRADNDETLAQWSGT